MKTLQKTIAAVALATLLFSSNLFAQNASANVKITLKKALGITNIGGSEILFTEVLLDGGTQTPSVDPENGAQFIVTGHPNRDATITFSSFDLTNDAWNAGNGTDDVLTFTPDIEQTGSSSSYSGASTVTSGVAETLVNVTGTGTLYLWAGGSVAVRADQEHGEYVGTFQIDVSY